jgi:neutral ceramidase
MGGRLVWALLLVLGCGGGGDEGVEVSLDHCRFEAVVATAGAEGVVEAGALEAGAAEAILDVPVGTALGAYTERAGFLGTTGKVDLREQEISGAFNNSIGVESAPRVKVVALSAGGETVVLIKLDLGLVYEGMLFDVEARLGASFAGKVLLAASHSHSAWGQQSGNPIYMVGLGIRRQLVYDRTLDQIEATARAALESRRAARLGVAVDVAFDSGDEITRDRRGENDALMGGPRKDDRLTLIRIDGADGAPIAAVPIYGVHGTINGADNSFASTDVTGAVERLMAERFATPVVVMHLQGAGADVSPTPAGSLDCAATPGAEGDPCFEWLRSEGNARVAVPTLEAAWEQAGAEMSDTLEIEMLTRSIELGPDPETFTVSGGALAYAPFSPERVADGAIFADGGEILSPIDEFNAPVGAALCEGDQPLFPAGLMPGTSGTAPYGGCVRLDTAADVLGQLLDIDFGVDSTHPVCESTRTTISALRLGDLLVGTVPGELSVLLAESLRARSPVAAERTVLIGYAQGHVGYCLTPEDWLAGGYEPSINAWGPLEAEHIGERLLDLWPLAITADREDGAAGGLDRVAVTAAADDFPIDEAPLAGTVPDPVPDRVWLRTGPAVSAQPAASIERVSGIATFVWIGDDPATRTPKVTLQRETAPGSGEFADVTRRSGRVVRDGDLLLMHTPLPVRREGDEPQTHHWAVQWQAVPWIGAVDAELGDLDGLDARAGVPLASYRFRVEGEGFEIFSDPFAVTPTSLGVAATRAGDVITASLTVSAAAGYRLLTLEGASNQPAPVAGGRVTATLALAGGGERVVEDLAVVGGAVTIDVTGEDVESVTIVDRFGNSGSAAVP